MLPWVCFWTLFLPVDFVRPDVNGAPRSLSEWRHRPVLVLAFLSTDCPTAGPYAKRLVQLEENLLDRGMAVIGVVPNTGESDAVVREWQANRGITFPILRDTDLQLCRRLGITRTPEVAVLDADRRLRYRGRIDDQFAPGQHGGRPGREHLRQAVTEIIARRPVSQPFTAPAGCPLQSPRTASTGRVTWHEQIAPVVHRRCVACHQPGGIGPFSLMTSGDAARRSRAIREAVAERRMPPWHADPNHGKFANDPSLTEAERELIEEWVREGAPAGDAGKAAPLPPIRAADAWRIGAPSAVYQAPVFEVPADGVLPYQHFVVDPQFTADHWIRAAELRPGNRAVVHHATVFLRPPAHPQAATQGTLQSFSLLTFTPGTDPLVLPAGMAKKIPRGWKLEFVIHYVPNGRPQQDQTALALQFADPRDVRREAATNLLLSENMVLGPGAKHVERRSRRFDRDVMLLSLYPHMHLRGTSFCFVATYPNGQSETLLQVPRWDMNWQHRYVLAEPKLLPAGTVLTAIGHYDNSVGNPNNPDPETTVHVGQQVTDEMFNGYYDFCLAHDLPPPGRRSLLWWVAGLLALCWLALRLRKR